MQGKHRFRRGILLSLLFGLIATTFVNVPSTLGATPYRCGTSVAPDQSTADSLVRNSYAAWKVAYVTTAGAGGFVRVQRPGDANDTVSEGIAYGMIFAAYLNDKATFDGLWRYAKCHFDENGLMHWRIDASNVVVGRYAATDADEDMALALMVADNTWGGYAADAKSLIGRIMQYEVEAGSYRLKPGDGWGTSDTTNPSYFAPAYYKLFSMYTGDARWDRVADTSYQIMANVRNGAETTGLQPDWTKPDGTRVPDKSYDYTYDAARVPWRLAKDAAWFCDPRATEQLNKLNAFFKRIGAPNIKDGYRLDGTVIGKYHNATFVAPAAAGSVITNDATYKTSMWNETVKLGPENYYNDSVRLLSLLFMSGNMAPPRIGPPSPLLDDFEGGTAKWTTFKDANSAITTSRISPGAVGSYAMQVNYRVATGGWAGVTMDFAPQNWSSYTALQFRFYGTNSGNVIRLEVMDNRAPGSTTDTSERFEYRIADTFSGWKAFSIPWGSFKRRADWQPTNAPSDGFGRTAIYGFNFTPTSGTGTFRLDHVALYKPTYTLLDNFEAGTAKWTTFKDANSAITTSRISPGAVGSYAMQVNYRVATGGWAGVTMDFAPQNWSSYTALQFRFYGTNSGNVIRLEVMDNRAPGSTTDTSERFEYRIADTFSGWKAFSIPWGSFKRRADWQPTNAPSDGFGRTAIYGFNFTPTSGTGTFRLDHVALLK